MRVCSVRKMKEEEKECPDTRRSLVILFDFIGKRSRLLLSKVDVALEIIFRIK